MLNPLYILFALFLTIVCLIGYIITMEARVASDCVLSGKEWISGSCIDRGVSE